MAATFNIGQVAAWLENWVDTRDFSRPGIDQSLGRVVANKAVERIATWLLLEHRSAEEYWMANSTMPSHWAPQGYKQRKQNKYGVADAPNVRTG